MVAVVHPVALAHTLVDAVMVWADRMPAAGYMLVVDTSRTWAHSVRAAQDIGEIEEAREVDRRVSPHFRGLAQN